MSTTTDLTYINAALTRIGEEPVENLDDGTTQAQIALKNYEIIVAKELGYRWRWATKSEQLSLLDEDTHGEPPEPWAYAYQLPADLLTLRTVKVDGVRVPYAQMFNKILTSSGGEEAEVVAEYIWRVPEQYWAVMAPLFAEGVTQRLEALFLRALGERHAEAAERDREATKTLLEARRTDAQSQTPVDPYEPYPILTARRA